MNPCLLALNLLLGGQTVMLVSEFGTGNLLGFDPASAAPIVLPQSFQPVGGVAGGADGMAVDADGRIYVNRQNGTVYRTDTEGMEFTLFATMPDASEDFFLLDLSLSDEHLFATQFASTNLYRIDRSNGLVDIIPGPPAASRFDGVRHGPDGRIYVVDSSDGRVFAWSPSTQDWSVFLDNVTGIDSASQLEFGDDGRVFISQTVNEQAQVTAYQLLEPGDWTSGLNPGSAQLIGQFSANSAATGIRISPEGRLYANAFNAGEVWRSNPGITAMETEAFITDLDLPGSILFLNGGSDAMFSDRFESINLTPDCGSHQAHDHDVTLK